MTPTLASVLLGVCGMVGWGVYDFLGGVLSKRLGSFVPLFWSQAVGAGTVTLAALALGASWHLTPLTLLFVVVAAGLYCGGYLFFFAGFEKGNVSIVAATMNLWAVVTMVVAFLVVGQRLSNTQMLGAVSIIAGATLASIDFGQVRQAGLQVSAGVRETLAGALLFGLYWNVSEVIAEDLGWLLATVLIKLAVATGLLGLAALRGYPLRPPTGSVRTTAVLVAMGVVEVLAVAAVNYGLTIGEAILITPIASALSVVTIALAVLFLREKVSALQALGMSFAIAGIITTAI